MQRDQLLIYPTIQDWYKKDPITSSRILDDYYRIKETTVHKLITEILKHPPKSFHLVIAGRHDPPLPIATLRAQGRVTEIRTQDICFNVAETQTLLNQLLGIEVDPSTAAAVEEKTEGWVTGVRLAALSMRHGADIDARLLEPHVDAQYVMEYAIDTGNQIMLQTSQAFEAELALRQGRLSEASSWVKRFYPKPFLAPFTFYMPQLALVKILLSQDTTNSRQQAADLLDQLDEFLASIHNNHFRIHVLALQAMLHDKQGEAPAALGKN